VPRGQMKPSSRMLAAHAAMALPLAFAGLPIYLHAPDFYATELGVPLADLGLALLLLRAVDAIQDPLLGSLSDRFRQGRALILAAGTAFLAGGMWMLFDPPSAWPLAWLTLSVFLCTTGFSIVSINLQTLGGLWSVSAHERTRISAWREAFGLAGLLLAVLLPELMSAELTAQDRFQRLVLVFLVLLLAALFILLRWLKHVPLDAPPPAARRLAWKAVLAGNWSRAFFAVHALSSLASAIPAVLVLFYIRDRLDAESWTGLFLLVYFLSGAASMPVWHLVAKRLGKLEAWALSMAMAVATFFWAVFLGPGDILAYAIICGLSGMALGADLALPPALLGDHIATTARQAVATRLYAVMAFLSKAALALATGIALPALDFFGYQPGETATGQTGILLSVVYAGLPCALKLMSLALVLSWRSRLSSNAVSDTGLHGAKRSGSLPSSAAHP